MSDDPVRFNYLCMLQWSRLQSEAVMSCYACKGRYMFPLQWSRLQSEAVISLSRRPERRRRSFNGAASNRRR